MISDTFDRQRLIKISREQDSNRRLSWTQALANAIVLQAVRDYREALRKQPDHPIAARNGIKDCEEFFRSEWFTLLTKLNGETLILKLRKEYADESQFNSRNT